jgi:hypothetical protein
VLQAKGVFPYNMCILKGFPTALKSATSFPFGLWFANSRTLYVADEGDGDNTYSAATGTYTAAARPAESFRTFESARSGEVLRGVSFTPGTLAGGR